MIKTPEEIDAEFEDWCWANAESYSEVKRERHPDFKDIGMINTERKRVWRDLYKMLTDRYNNPDMGVTRSAQYMDPFLGDMAPIIKEMQEKIYALSGEINELKVRRHLQQPIAWKWHIVGVDEWFVTVNKKIADHLILSSDYEVIELIEKAE